jgi:C1A family cysteine protease
VNKFAHFSTDEFQATFTGECTKGGCNSDIGSAGMPTFAQDDAIADVPSEVDWSQDASVVGPVEDQGSCGSCWAFAAAGETAMIYALKTGTLLTLSKQQLVDCAKDAYDNPDQGGCEGGLSSLTWQAGGYYDTSGACLESAYPYTATDAPCLTTCAPVIPPGAIVGLGAVPRGFDNIKAGLMDRPLKVSVHADSVWHSFSSGGAEASVCYTGTNHAVIAVGYDGDSYVKIRNSWGPDWGLGGYINIGMNNTCETGPFSLFYRTPYYPQFASAIAV